MQLIRGFHNLANYDALKKGCVLTIGNFDGVHIGHQNILARLCDQSLAIGLPSVVMLFEPQPREFFAKNSQNQTASALSNAVPARLMRLRDKLKYLAEMGVDFVLCVNFNQKFAKYSAEDFITELLVKKLKVRYLSVGDDFRFGIERRGNFEMLRNAGLTHRFAVEESHTHRFDTLRISSSLIRQALQQNDLALVENLLGKPYSIRGRVAHGNKLGRTIGFPTANIMLNRLVTPIQGVFIVEVQTIYGRFNGIANVGNRPTINGTKPLLEVHIFDFNNAIYHQIIEVIFIKKIRDELKFASFTLLKEQIEKDCQQAVEFFNQLPKTK
ncbi:bifunctional riboflavin kinase/FMN adenylyltransferase [[Haemophilus] ducreyi]|uniref:Riboflavin biosynthesis protein n=2 Tax=Haemophilus ducreyi TaxID=730 RepID=Q7VP33_HAEDU|nr:bifunctional riboflavin kinase/FAD synthetase [[Haemophilus] ducreyi]AAP95254.1 riboflavin biosynthesis protein RibF [[Haemophilus] ducreyi 35000HP]AKO31833.1 FMN adenylyltransferase [[Haemophilus] ducreyi]AKO33285.1 FMN adenylyltransferase [[Haemophilus] ducreyi]AKO34735.1 FMN adenylyltransferase [[Haemophilus] ducreyi]AKO36162.1 FMN adenylyltransferase [[Haemophilus] ducreyi]